MLGLLGKHLRVAGEAKSATTTRERRLLIVAVLSQGSREGKACPIHSLFHGWDSSEEERGSPERKER